VLVKEEGVEAEDMGRETGFRGSNIRCYGRSRRDNLRNKIRISTY
jgi:hypothetical protein